MSSPQDQKNSNILPDVHYINDAEKYFKALDKNMDNFLDHDEIRQLLINTGIPVKPALVKQIFDECDENHYGKISFKEFISYSKRKDEILKKIFVEMDSDQSGSINNDEIKEALARLKYNASDEDCLALIKQIDRDGDGRITYDEFLNFLYLLPAQNLKYIFDHWSKSASIDLGESFTIPDEKPKGTSIMTTLVAGGVAGAFSRTATAPLDRLKVILQAQTQGKSSSMLNGLLGIYKEGGLKAFFRGNGTNVLKIIPETGVKFLTYDKIKDLLCRDPHNASTLERLGSGAAAGLVSQTLIYPLEITKTRLALAPAGTYNGIFGCIKTIMQKEGTLALYKGWFASVAGIIPYASIDMAIFSLMRDAYIAKFEVQPTVKTLLICGATSGICGQVVSYPLALIRTRLQSQGLPGRKIEYDGVVDCVRKTIDRDGFFGLYRGIVPNFMKSIPAISISYAVVETVKQWMA